jgi:2-isopropylmalate synthase
MKNQTVSPDPSKGVKNDPEISSVLDEMSKLGLYVQEKMQAANAVLQKTRELEALGYKFDDAKASFHLLILETLGYVIRPFEVMRWQTTTSRALNSPSEVSGEVEVKIFARDGSFSKQVSAVGKGVGPIHAVDIALRQCVKSDFPELEDLTLSSYSLNIVDSSCGTAGAARARVEFAERSSASESWATVAVSEDVLDASIKALVDGYRYKLIFRNEKSPRFAIPDWKVALSWRYSSQR